MDKHFIEDETFDAEDYTEKVMVKAEFDHCHFKNCIFSGADLRDMVYLECTFENCDFSNAKISNTAIRDCSFLSCKMLGFRFEDCNDFLFGADFENCQLDLSSFYRKNLKRKKFINCSLKEVDFTEADLSEVLFDGSDLMGAVFEATRLDKADFRSAHHYAIDPESNSIKKARFSPDGLQGLLAKYDIKIG